MSFRTEKVSAGTAASTAKTPAPTAAQRLDELIARHNDAKNDVTSGWWNKTTTPKLGDAEAKALFADLGGLEKGHQKDVVRELESRVNDGTLKMTALGLIDLLRTTKSLGMKSKLREQHF